MSQSAKFTESQLESAMYLEASHVDCYRPTELFEKTVSDYRTPEREPDVEGLYFWGAIDDEWVKWGNGEYKRMRYKCTNQELAGKLLAAGLAIISEITKGDIYLITKSRY